MAVGTPTGIIDLAMTASTTSETNHALPQSLKGIGVLILRGHKLHAEALAWALGQRGTRAIWVTRDPDEALEIAGRERPDVVLVDLDRHHLSGLRVGKTIRRTIPVVKVLAITGIGDRSAARAAMGADFHGSIDKDTPILDFAEAVSAALAGHPVWTSQSHGPPRPMSFRRRPVAALEASLSPREREILALLVHGMVSRDIAGRLSIAPNTLRSHVQNILTKLGVHSRLEAAALAVEYGLVPARGALHDRGRGTEGITREGVTQ